MTALRTLARRRDDYARNRATGHHINAQHPVIIPDDVTVLDRDPSPCFRCGANADLPCRHRPWMLREREYA